MAGAAETAEAPELVEAYLAGARSGSTAGVYIEGDVLHLGGMWQAVLRLDDDVYLVRAEAPPDADAAALLDRLRARLSGRGVQPIPGEHPLVQAVTYAELSVVAVDWELWATDPERGQARLAHRAAPDAMAQDWVAAEPGPEQWSGPLAEPAGYGDMSAEFAKSMVGGMPRTVVLAVDCSEEVVAGLEATVPDCRVEARAMGEAVSACGVLVPHAVVVDARTERARRFLLEFRAEACGRHVPVAALAEGEPPPGADVALDPRLPAQAWQDTLIRLLP